MKLILTVVDVKTTSGRVRGRVVVALNTTLYQFQGIPYAEPPIGIPYAEPPIGALRFAKPKPIQEPRNDIIDATKPGNSCLQKELPNAPEVQNQSEDSLVLNIWTPTLPTDNTTNQSLKPVMFWIYGGGLSVGTINMFNGGPLAAHDVVFVAPNYRLGYFGFLYGDREDAPGNVGFYDQLLALKWVRENIHQFGGDRDQITIFGMSAGSLAVSAHILSPLSKGLFKRAIMQGGAHMYNKDRDLLSKAEAIAGGKRLAKELGCSEDMDWIQFLRTVDAKDLVEKTRFLSYPVLDTEFLPLSARKAFQEKQFNSDLMAGISSNEGSILSEVYVMPNKKAGVKASDNLYHNIDVQKVIDYYLKGVDTSSTPALKRAFYEFVGDLWIKYPTYEFARQMATSVGNRHNIYFYELSYQSPFYAKILECNDEDMAVGHGMEMPFVFGQPFLGQTIKYFDTTDRKFSRAVMRMWTNFAKYGKPNDKWPQLLSDPNVPKVKDLNP
ncbi:unnamed protein product, partial [Medioppia subpectinata]